MYAKCEQHFAAVYKQNKDKYVNIYDFKKSEAGKVELAKFQAGGECYKKLHSEFKASQLIPEKALEPIAGPYRVF